MLRQIGIILFSSGMILAFISTSQYDSIVQEVLLYVQNQWPFVLIFVGFICMAMSPVKSRKSTKKSFRK
jgi:uncharacterized membrane protein